VVCGSSKLCVAVLAVGGVLVLSPAAALADSCPPGTSAVSIYSECIPTASGGSHHNQGGGHHKKSPTTTTPTYTYTTPAVTVTPSKKVQKTLAHAHHNQKLLKRIVTDPSLGATQAVAASASYPTTTPNALGAVFDLGSGPTALFAMLAAAAILLVGFGGFRGRRQRKL
jgi:hypothetical protein